MTTWISGEPAGPGWAGAGMRRNKQQLKVKPVSVQKNPPRPIPKELLQYGEVKIEAKRFKMDLQRAYKLLQGKIKSTDNDRSFIMALYDKALKRKQDKDKLKTLAA